MTNPSIVLYGAGNAKVEERPVPELKDPNDVIIRMNYIGVCGSDVHFWTHGGIGDKIVTAQKPIVMGHEGCGTIDQVGSNVKHLRQGDRVAIEPARVCRMCDRCKEGLYNLCPAIEFAACPPDTPGLLSKYWRAAADFCYKLPENTSLAEGVLAEPLAVAAHAVRMVDIRPGDKLVVFGAGTIGLLSAAVARHYGAKRIIVVDILDHKLEMANELTASETFKPDASASYEQNSAHLIEDHTLGLGADKVIEATGAESCTNMAIHVLRPGGSMVQTGLGRPSINFPIVVFSEKEIHMHGAFRYGPGDFAAALDMLEKRAIAFDRLISHVFSFEQATEAWEATKRGDGIKNVIRGIE